MVFALISTVLVCWGCNFIWRSAMHVNFVICYPPTSKKHSIYLLWINVNKEEAKTILNSSGEDPWPGWLRHHQGVHPGCQPGHQIGHLVRPSDRPSGVHLVRPSDGTSGRQMGLQAIRSSERQDRDNQDDLPGASSRDIRKLWLSINQQHNKIMSENWNVIS